MNELDARIKQNKIDGERVAEEGIKLQKEKKEKESPQFGDIILLGGRRGEERKGRQEDESFRQLRPAHPWVRTSGHIKGFSVSAG